MKNKVTFESALRFTKLSVYLAYTWPPSRIATKWKIVKYDIAIVLSIVSTLCLIIPVLRSIFVYQSNFVVVTQSIIFGNVGCNCIIKTLVYRIRRKRIQVLTDEMEDFVKNPKSHEQTILQYYLDKCWIFHVVVTVTIYFTDIAVLVGPLMTEQSLPVFAVYPFSLDSKFINSIVYLHQIIVGFQISAGLTTDCQMALIMWFATARLEILAGEIKRITNVREFQMFVEKHQRLLAYAIEVSETMSYTAFITSAMCGIGTILCCIQLVSWKFSTFMALYTLVTPSDQPLSEKMQFGPGMILYLMNLFVCAWPAENLLHVCQLMANAAYDTSWTDMSTDWMKNVLVILRRSHRPIKVSIGGFIPTLSLNFYGSFLSAAFSYFTTLRTAMTMDSEN